MGKPVDPRRAALGDAAVVDGGRGRLRKRENVEHGARMDAVGPLVLAAYQRRRRGEVGASGQQAALQHARGNALGLFAQDGGGLGVVEILRVEAIRASAASCGHGGGREGGQAVANVERGRYPGGDAPEVQRLGAVGARRDFHRGKSRMDDEPPREPAHDFPGGRAGACQALDAGEAPARRPQDGGVKRVRRREIPPEDDMNAIAGLDKRVGLLHEARRRGHVARRYEADEGSRCAHGPGPKRLARRSTSASIVR